MNARANLDAGGRLKRGRIFFPGESLEAALPAFRLVDVIDNPRLFFDALLGFPRTLAN
jgi:hypothetical protein